MSVIPHIHAYLASLPDTKQSDLTTLHEWIVAQHPTSLLWYLDGKDAQGKVVSNPNIGYGKHTITYANGTTREWYQLGISANSTGISVYVFGMDDKTFLKNTYGDRLGKASITGYCVKFKSLAVINRSVLEELIHNALK